MKTHPSTICGLDFGTSNTTLGISQQGKIHLAKLENNKPPIRSAIYYDNHLHEFSFGQQGIDAYFENASGRLMMALKSVLGSNIMHDKTLIGKNWISYADILGHFIAFIKTKAEIEFSTELTHVVAGRPVKFHDHDLEKDKIAQNMLEDILKKQGFKEIIFQYEPIAAAKTYETTLQNEELAFIIDMGGGTSDFTIIRLDANKTVHDRKQDVLANDGIHIAGTDFDRNLSLAKIMPLLGLHSLMRGSSSDIEVPSYFYQDLTTWHKLHQLYNNKTLASLQQLQAIAYEKNLIQRLIEVIEHKNAHQLLEIVEQGKKQLSQQEQINLNLDLIETDLSTLISQTEFNNAIQTQLDAILNKIHETIRLACIKPSDITALFYTGGTTQIPLIRKEINKIFPHAKTIQGDVFGSVGAGLTIDAVEKFS